MDPTSVELQRFTRDMGFPAHAGMDPLMPARWTGGSPGFPRPRGDGPVSLGGGAGQLHRGFPAHAGMDPATRASLIRGNGRGFPAHAGMDPRPATVVNGLAAAVSPPTRGWTRYATPPAAVIFPDGFPAHAGMDPFSGHAGRRAGTHGVSPPTRGWTVIADRRLMLVTQKVSPPTRGWTSSG